MKSVRNGIVLVAWAILIAACGGGGGGGGSTPPPPLSSDASLSSLSVTGATFDAAFSPSVTSYTATVPNSTNSLDVSATTSDGNASFTINGSNNATVALAVGDNTIPIVVTAENGTTTRTYTIVVTREGASPPPPQAAIKMAEATNTMTLLTDFMLYHLSYRQLGGLGVLRGVICGFSEEARTRGFPSPPFGGFGFIVSTTNYSRKLLDCLIGNIIGTYSSVGECPLWVVSGPFD